VGIADVGLAAVQGQPWYRGQIRHVERREATEARYQAPASALDGAVAGFLAHHGYRLYRHQAQAIDAWRSGSDVVLATATSSGKSLVFSCCAAQALMEDPQATALLLYPTKALARDQLHHLQEMDGAVNLGSEPAALDGDTPSTARSRIRRASRIVVSNPYALHEYLAQPDTLRRFLAHLTLVVVDEAHRYRGIFGTHVALVLRRLTRLATRSGADPRFILASGTIANPGDHGEALIGRPVVVVGADGAAAGRRTVALFDATRDVRRSPGVQAAGVVGALVEAGLVTICFAGSRVLAELIGRWTTEVVPHARISSYRAGYLAAERRDIEDALRRGTLDAVISTNALELGIDIGGLDAVVLAGYPGTVASTWQQIGRAGRRGAEALAVLVAGDDPLDAYIVRRPTVLFGAPMERAVLALSNPTVLAGQVLCAAAEAPLTAADAARFGPQLAGIVDDLAAEGLVASVPAGTAFCGAFRPASVVRIDGRVEGSVVVRVSGVVLEVLDRWRATAQAHPGAVFFHRGESFRVLSLDLITGEAVAEPADGTEHTTARVTRRYELGSPEQNRRHRQWEVALGPVEVRSQVVGYKLVRGSEVLANEPLAMPEFVLQTRALRLALASELGTGTASTLVPRHVPELGERGPDLAALHGAEHGLIHALPLMAMCDRQDVGGFSTRFDAGSGVPTIVIYDGYEGGAGIVDVMFDRLEDVAGLAVDMVAGCDCDTGCPRCLFDRSCGSGNNDLDRQGALAMLRSMVIDS